MELRAVFLDGESAWGGVALYRRQGRFEAREVIFVAEVAAYIAQGIRRAILTTAIAWEAGPDPPGLILLSPDNSVESVTPAAQRWLSEMVGPTTQSGEVPLAIASVAQRARQALGGRIEELARARVPRRTGGWLLLDAALLDDDSNGRVGVIVQLARTPEIAALIAAAYGLSSREREVARLVVCGLSTREVAGAIDVSPYTVQDHLKAIFRKVGVRSRGELVAQLFLQHYAPRLQGGAKIGPDGWFAEEAVAFAAGPPAPPDRAN